ncbi:hypothetical protein BDN70DRAFT_886565 [Pholiota conissans]|uniref:BTB domain-containing protein n=1 Tax=Pholiota conissans TaxID=109636 RepID=A0A9P6CT88_9AGAR|nr:hypothetical protein BDN70DRAFT_886565 [Pholiota conissans]
METAITMDTTSTSTAPATSALFCSPTADVEFISSSNTLFKLHSTHLTPQTSAGLAQLATGCLDISDPVRLTESSEVLEILFQFIEPPSSDPSGIRGAGLLEEVDPTLFFSVAEAAEKYGVSSTVSECHARMKTLLLDYPLEILDHSTLHAHAHLADKAAYQALSTPLSSAALKLTAPGLLARYVVYYSSWLDVTHTITSFFYSNTRPPCTRSASLYHALSELLHGETPRVVGDVAYVARSVSLAMDLMHVECLDDYHAGCPCRIDCVQLDERVRREVAGMGRFSEARVEGSR